MNASLLARLKEDDGFCRLEDLGPDIALIRSQLEELERFGFRLEWHPYLGVAYRGPAERLCPDQIEHDLGTRCIGRRIAVWKSVGSTNDLAASAAGSRSNEGIVILAERQSAGRGRRGRVWEASEGSALLMSTLLFPQPPLNSVPWLTALGAVAVAETVRDTFDLPPRIKWPNDVRVSGQKIAGILVERGEGSVIGIGVNVNSSESDFPDHLRSSATSLRQLRGGEPIDRSDFARALIRTLDRLYCEGLDFGPERLDRAWCDLLEPLGRPVVITMRTCSKTGLLIAAELGRGLCLSEQGGEVQWIDHAEIVEVQG